MLFPVKAWTQNRSCNPDALAACDQALRDSEESVAAADKVIELTTKMNIELRDENQQLSDALVSMTRELDSTEKDLYLYAGGGLLAGLVIGFLVSK